MRDSIWFLYRVEEHLENLSEAYLRLAEIGEKFPNLKEDISVVLLEIEDIEKYHRDPSMTRLVKDRVIDGCRFLGKQLMGRFIKMRPPIMNPNAINPNE